MLKAIALSFPLMCLALPLNAQNGTVSQFGGASIACYYMIISMDHDDALDCGQPFDAEHEANYQTIHTAMEDYIRTYAGPNGDAILAALKRSASHKAGTPREDVCEKFAARRNSAGLLTSAETVAKLQDLLKTTPNPMAGGCL